MRHIVHSQCLCSQTDRQTDRETDRQTDRQTARSSQDPCDSDSCSCIQPIISGHGPIFLSGNGYLLLRFDARGFLSHHLISKHVFSLILSGRVLTIAFFSHLHVMSALSHDLDSISISLHMGFLMVM